MAPDKSALLQQPLQHQPRAFELCSSAHTQALWEGSKAVNPQRALPVTSSAWKQLHKLRLAASPLAPTDEPWWLDLERAEAAGRALFYVHPELPCFVGHFPGQPLLPGVVQLEWAMGLAQHLWPAECPTQNFAGLARLKFKAPVQPGAVLAMELRRTTASTSVPADSSLSLAIKTPAQTSTSARFIYRE